MGSNKKGTMISSICCSRYPPICRNMVMPSSIVNSF